MSWIKVDEKDFDLLLLSQISQAFTPSQIGSGYGSLLWELSDAMITGGPGINGAIYGLHNSRNQKTWTELSYDPVNDYLIISTGETERPSYAVVGPPELHPQSYPCTGHEAHGFIIFGAYWFHYVIKADALEPSMSLDYRDTSGATPGCFGQIFPLQTCSFGCYTDPNTGVLYNRYKDLIQEVPRGAVIGDGMWSYGSSQFLDIEPIERFGYVWDPISASESECPVDTRIYYVMNWVGLNGQSVLSNNGLSQKIHDDSYGLYGIQHIPGAITLDDVGIFAIGDSGANGMLFVRKRTGNEDLGTHTAPWRHAMQLCPAGRDRFLVVCWQDSLGSELDGIVYRYNRGRKRVEIEHAGRIPTTHTYPPGRYRNDGSYMGMATYDTKRQMLILLKPDFSGFERYVIDTLCHPISPSTPLRVALTSPMHAGSRSVDLEMATFSDYMPIRDTNIKMMYDPSGDIIEKPSTVASDVNGIAASEIRLSSAAENTTISIQSQVSSFDIVASSVIIQDSTQEANFTLKIPGGALDQIHVQASSIRYGVSPMTILSASASFTVSSTVSASLSAGAIQAATTILAMRPVLTSDAVGVGSPRQLIYPTSQLPSPLNYEINPHIWTNMLDEPLTRPIYQSTKTLTKTANVQFDGDLSDIEIQEIWMGGGDRASMSLEFFSLLYDYYMNVPDFDQDGFIQWAPRDVSMHVYNVMITDLSVGNAKDVRLNSLAKVSSGWIYDTVTMTLRIISQVV